MPLVMYAVVMTVIAIVLLAAVCILFVAFKNLARDFVRFQEEQFAGEREVWNERDAYQNEVLYYQSLYGPVSPEVLAAWEKEQELKQWVEWEESEQG